jgi:hypothetical protein
LSWRVCGGDGGLWWWCRWSDGDNTVAVRYATTSTRSACARVTLCAETLKRRNRWREDTSIRGRECGIGCSTIECRTVLHCPSVAKSAHFFFSNLHSLPRVWEPFGDVILSSVNTSSLVGSPSRLCGRCGCHAVRPARFCTVSRAHRFPTFINFGFQLFLDNVKIQVPGEGAMSGDLS